MANASRARSMGTRFVKLILMKKRYFYIISCVLSVVTACGEDHRREAIIAAKIKERVEEFKSKKISDCRNSALDIAVTKADSILLKNADLWQIQGTDIPRPPRPTKPSEPKIKTKIDSSAATPLFPIK